MVFIPSSVIEPPIATPHESPPIERIVPVKKRRYAAVIESTTSISSSNSSIIQKYPLIDHSMLTELLEVGDKCIAKMNIDQQLFDNDLFSHDAFGGIFEQFYIDILLCSAQYQSVIDRCVNKTDIRSQLQLVSAHLATGNLKKCTESAIAALTLSTTNVHKDLLDSSSSLTQHAIHIDIDTQIDAYAFRIVTYCMRRRLQSTSSDRLLGQLIIISQLNWTTYGRELFDSIYEQICNGRSVFVYRNLLAHITNLDILEHFSYLSLHRDSLRLQLTDAADTER